MCVCVRACVRVCVCLRVCVVSVSGPVVDMVDMGSDKRRPPTGPRFLNGRMGGTSHKTGSDANLVGGLCPSVCTTLCVYEYHKMELSVCNHSEQKMYGTGTCTL